MFNKIFKKKKYDVCIIYKDKVEYVETLAKNKKEAKQIVTNILMNCNLFKVKSSSDFILKVFKKGVIDGNKNK